MSQMLAQFHFLRPWWLLAALVWAPWLVWWMRRARAGRSLHRLVDAALLPHLLSAEKGTGRAAWSLPWLAAILVTLALAGPTWSRLSQPLYGHGAAQVVVVSLSPRMLATDVKPDRMRRVRYKVHDLLHANADGSNALVAYTGAAFVVAPLSADAHALDELVNALAPDVMPVAGDAPDAGLREGLQLLTRAGQTRGALVLVTDKADAAAQAAARAAGKAGMRVSVLGVGSTGSAPVRLPNGRWLRDADGKMVMAGRDDATLEAVADAGGGIYVPMSSGQADIHALKAELGASRQGMTASHRQADQWQDMGPWLLLPLLIVAALAFRRGWLLLLPLVLLPHAAVHAQAAPVPTDSTTASRNEVSEEHGSGSWTGWWRNGDQRAADALREGHPERARGVATSPGMRGAAAYRAGDHAAAAKAFARVDDADGAYNLGNALAKQGKYEDALKAYAEALRRNPDLDDAKANRKAVQAWLEKHKSSNKKPGRGASKPGQSGTDHDPDASSGKSKTKSKTKTLQSNRGKGQGDHGKQGAHSSPPSASSLPAPAASTGISAKPDPLKPKGSKPETDKRGSGSQPDPGQPEQTAGDFKLGRMPATAGSSLPAPMEKALQRVRDDPGGLLRRKFELEYRQRRHGNREGMP